MQTIQFRSSLIPDPDRGPAPDRQTWIDIEVADDEGRRWLATESGLDDEIVSRLLEPAPATHWRRFGRGLHLNVRAAVPGGDASTIAIVDFGIWLEPSRIITVRRGKVPALERAAEAYSTGGGPSNSWELTVFVLSEAQSRLEQNLHDLSAAIDQLEDDVLTGVGDPPIDRVAALQKRLVYARRFRAPLANLVSFVSSQAGSDIDGELRDEFERVVTAVAQNQELLGLSVDRASALQGQIRDQLADSMNQATYRFTWVATVFLPLSFLTGLLGINVAGIPGNHNPLAFWVVCGALCVVAATWGIVVGRVTSPFGRRRRPRHRSAERPGPAAHGDPR
jgi:zinc transporter